MRNATVGAARALGLLAAFLVISVVSGALAAGLFLPAVGAAGSVTRATVDGFNGIEAEFEEPPLSEVSTMFDRDGKVIAKFFRENRIRRSLNKISPHMQNAIIAIEDSRFYQHGGVDPQGLLRAAVTNELSDGASVQGASTLTQQYVKNVFVEAAAVRGDKAGVDAAIEKSNGRKLREIRIAMQLEKTRTKREILEGYLNIANFGDASYGVEAASQYFFSVPASKLTIPQAALLAGLVQQPEEFKPFVHPDRSLKRRNVVLSRMRDLSMITPQQYRQFSKTKLGLKKTKPQNGCITAKLNMGYFCDYARKVIALDEAKRFGKLGRTQADRTDKMDRDGLKIYTTIDPQVQAAAYKAITKRVPVADRSNVVSSAVTVEPGTGEVLAMAQNKVFSPDEKKRGDTEINFAVDSHYGGSVGFQTGSTFKGFTLAAWLADGNGLGDVVDAKVRTYQQTEFKSCARMGGPPYTPQNSESGEEGPVSVLEATSKSVNTAFIAMERSLDLCDISKLATRLGAHTAAPNETCTPGKPTTAIPNCIPSLTLGPFNIAPINMALGYATFAAEGTYCPPNPITAIKDRNGKDIPIGKTSCDQQALDPEVAHGVNYALKTVLKPGGTANRIPPLGVPVAGKTGTADDSFDTWFVGYTKQRATAVWVGDPTVYPEAKVRGKCGPAKFCRRSLNRLEIGGKQYRSVYGATIAAPIWRDVMGVAQRGLPKQDWPDPPAKMIRGKGLIVPDVAGRSISEASAILFGAGFQVRVSPTPIASEVPAGAVAGTSPRAGSLFAPGGTVTILLSRGNGSVVEPPDGEQPGPPGPPDRGRGPGRPGPPPPTP